MRDSKAYQQVAAAPVALQPQSRKELAMPEGWTVTPHHTAIKVRDLEVCTAFFRDTLGLTPRMVRPDWDNPEMVWFEGIQLVQASDEDQNSPEGWRLFHVALQPDNGEAVVADLKAQGYQFKPHEAGNPWFFDGPEGIEIELLP